MLQRKHTGLKPGGVFTDGSMVKILCLHCRVHIGQRTKTPHDMQCGPKMFFNEKKMKSRKGLIFLKTQELCVICGRA